MARIPVDAKSPNGYINPIFSPETYHQDNNKIVIDVPGGNDQDIKDEKIEDNNMDQVVPPQSPRRKSVRIPIQDFRDERLEKDEAAIVVVNACKSYQHGNKNRPILHNFCMTVKQGTIYSLLGSSGCGKTTLLACVVGMRKLDAGKILIYGAKTGTVASGVPGKRVGYMPQETALYKDFTIRETITYFGSLYGMKSKEIESNREVLMNLLSLPEDDQRVSTLSGGQKRRVSLAVTLIHSPELLILDEPTVGVDPLLRDNIWQYLMKLVSNGRTTVIITTHYIDEARNSDTVGVMRGGRLLTEKSPKLLFEEFKTQNLEEVVLKLCHEDEKDSLGFNRTRSKSGNITGIRTSKPVTVDRRYSHPNISRKQSSIKQYTNPEGGWYGKPSFKEEVRDSITRLKSLIMKNGFVMMRNFMFVLFVILLPSLQTIIMGMSMGNDPKSIRLGVVNHDFNETGGCPLELSQEDQHNHVNLILNGSSTEGDCSLGNLSCRYLRSLPLDDTIQLHYYSTEEEAREDIRSGALQSFLIFSQGYSDAMYERSLSSIGIDNETLHKSLIRFEMDASNAVITQSLMKIVHQAFQKFSEGMLKECGLDPDIGGVPIKFQNPIYGSYSLTLREYMVAGILVGIALFFPMCSASITYIWDKKQGTMERARVAGTQTWEIMMSYFVTEGIVLTMQSTLSFLIMRYIFQVEVMGSTVLAFALLALNGCTGISLGLLISAFCKEEIQATLLGLAIVFPNYFLAGSLWPLQGMPVALQYVAYILPGTLANEAFRSIVVKGWGFSHFHVWRGFASTGAWLCFYWGMSILIHRFKLKQ